MQQFVVGFVLAVLFTVPVVVLLVRRQSRMKNRKRREKAVPRDGANEAKAEHLRQLEELGKLTGGLAHEIKNPLSTIKINLKLISEDLEAANIAGPGRASPDRDDRRFARALRKIAVIQKETDRLEQILDGFLRYIDKTQLQPARVDINELISSMLDFYSPQAHSHSITVREGLHNEPLICKVDAGMLKQVVLNLFINAQQAMSRGGELMIRTRRQSDDAVIQISDTLFFDSAARKRAGFAYGEEDSGSAQWHDNR
jgi:signal transduction histidine kinase